MQDSLYQTHYDEATVRITSLSNFRPTIIPIYSPTLFAEDWVKNKLIDWEQSLSALLDRTSTCISSFEGQLKKYGRFRTLPPSFIPSNAILQELGLSSGIEFLERTSNCRFASEHIDQVKAFQDSIQQCFSYYEENKHLPPFSEKFSINEKIPFWGSQDEFALMIHVLTNCDFVLMNKKGTRKFPGNPPSAILKQFETYTSRKKKDLATLFCRYFIGISIKGDKIVETDFNPATVDGRLNDTRLSELSTDFFIDRYEMLKNHFQEIKNSKEPPSHQNADAKHEKKK
jgi:hypothetical protein